MSFEASSGLLNNVWSVQAIVGNGSDLRRLSHFLMFFLLKLRDLVVFPSISSCVLLEFSLKTPQSMLARLVDSLVTSE